MRYGWPLLPGSFGPRRRMRHRPVCSASRERSGGRKASRWATAYAASEDCPGRSPLARHLCTTPPSGSAAPPLYSWEWRARLWRRSGRRDAPQSAAGSPPDADGILKVTKDVKLRIKEQKPDKWYGEVDDLFSTSNEWINQWMNAAARLRDGISLGVAFLSSWTNKTSVMWKLCTSPRLYGPGWS